MSEDGIPVTFEYRGKTCVTVPAGTTILEAAHLAGINILATCGGRGTCGKCGVRITQGVPGPSLPAVRAVTMPRGVYLACLVTVDSPVSVRPLNVIRPPRD